MLATYDESSLVTTGEAWAIEDRVLRAWQGSGFDPAEIEKRRAGDHRARPVSDPIVSAAQPPDLSEQESIR